MTHRLPRVVARKHHFEKSHGESHPRTESADVLQVVKLSSFSCPGEPHSYISPIFCLGLGHDEVRKQAQTRTVTTDDIHRVEYREPPSANPAPPWIALDGFFLTTKYRHAVNQYLLRKIDLRTRLRVQGDLLIFIGTNKKLLDDAQRSDLDEIQGRRRARSRRLQQESRRSADNDPHRREHRQARHRRDAQDAHPRYGGGHRRHHRFGHEARLLTDDDHRVDSNQAPIQ
ncbi:hypothetical protein BDN70DRAFT_604051 [Pholiota conissans]|uniref:Uncharacterized protein n=1 Tax=Pholiota conissans TaxID=109636 RepID=A0A9P5Z5H6_9AGAR|nr:hypothetical protein BDN70DRAFT_604051 [Pholiota conissans]